MYRRATVVRPFIERFTGRSLFFVEGQEHRQMRDALIGLFTHERVKAMSEDITATTEKLVRALQEHIAEHSNGPNGAPFTAVFRQVCHG